MVPGKNVYGVMLFVESILAYKRFLFIQIDGKKMLPQERLSLVNDRASEHALVWYQESSMNGGFKELLGESFEKPKTFPVEFLNFTFIVFVIDVDEQLRALLNNPHYTWLEENDVYLRTNIHSAGDSMILAEYKQRGDLHL